MRSRSLAAQHDATVSRRLELLTTELAGSGRAIPEVRLGVNDRGAGPDGGSGPAPSVVRLPGRHASRARSAAWLDAVPEGLRGRLALGQGQLAVVAVLMVLGLVITCWWLVRSGGHQVAAPTALVTPHDALATPGGAASGPAAPAVATSTPPSATVVVDVTGKVRRPGIAVLRQGARVVDALRAAGGARPGVDLGGLNLAQVLTDGEQVVVGGSAPAVGTSAGPSEGAGGSGLVDINTADETTLESLPEIGPVTAGAIIAWRSQHGGFTSVDQLLDVDGIGDATLAKLTPYVTV